MGHIELQHQNPYDNYKYKIVNPLPLFKFPIPSTEATSLNTVTESITAAVTKVIDGLTSTTLANQSVTEQASNVTEEIVRMPVTDTSVLAEATTSFSATELVQNGTDSLFPLNDTSIEATTISQVLSSTAANTNSFIYDTTEKAVTLVRTTTTDYNHEATYYAEIGSHRLLYIILLVIIICLVLIALLLIMIYVRYRRNSFMIHNYYEVSPMKERTPSDNGPPDQNVCPNELYVAHRC